jgi:hypothetical protein
MSKKTPTPTVESLLDDVIVTMKLGHDAIRSEIELIIKGKAGKSKYDKASRISFHLQRLGQIAESIRKVEAARAKRLDAVTPAMVLAFLRSLDASERAQILREATLIDSRKSGLA